MTKTVKDYSEAVSGMASEWPAIDALMGGTRTMRAAKKSFLPQWPSEEDAFYAARLASAVLHPVYSRTCAVMAAKPFAKTINLKNIKSTAILSLLENVDLAGTNIHAFGYSAILKTLSHGFCGVLVDYPTVAKGVKSKAEEKQTGARPYFAFYPAGTVLGWLEAKGKLTQIRLLEHVKLPDGWGEKQIEQVRVLTVGAWETFRKNDKEEWVLFETGINSLSEIPFVFFTADKGALGVSAPPLVGLAYQNIEHWQTASDHKTIVHVASVPILFGAGFGTNDQIIIGSSKAVTTGEPTAKLQYIEHTGAAIGAGRTAILDIEDRMRKSGAELISDDRTAVTATQVSSENKANISQLGLITELVEDSLNQCLRLMGAWLGESDIGELELFKDFETGNNLDDQGLLLGAVDRSVISKETFYSILQKRNLIDQESRWADESERIKQQPTESPKPV